jgi:hypothetical protein
MRNLTTVVLGFFCLLSLEPSFAVVSPPASQVASVVGIGAAGSTASPSSLLLNQILGSNRVFTITCGGTGGQTSTNFYPCYKDGTAYAVTSGKKAYCFDQTCAGATVNLPYQLVSATAAIAENVGSLTGGVYQGGATQKYPLKCSVGTAHVPYPIAGVYVFDASSAVVYPGFQAGSTDTYQLKMNCIEQ